MVVDVWCHWRHFLCVRSCFLSLLLVAAVVWKIKQSCWASRRREVCPASQPASRPSSIYLFSLNIKDKVRFCQSVFSSIPKSNAINGQPPPSYTHIVLDTTGCVLGNIQDKFSLFSKLSSSTELNRFAFVNKTLQCQFVRLVCVCVCVLAVFVYTLCFGCFCFGVLHFQEGVGPASSTTWANSDLLLRAVLESLSEVTRGHASHPSRTLSG